MLEELAFGGRLAPLPAAGHRGVRARPRRRAPADPHRRPARLGQDAARRRADPADRPPGAGARAQQRGPDAVAARGARKFTTTPTWSRRPRAGLPDRVPDATSRWPARRPRGRARAAGRRALGGRARGRDRRRRGGDRARGGELEGDASAAERRRARARAASARRSSARSRRGEHAGSSWPSCCRPRRASACGGSPPRRSARSCSTSATTSRRCGATSSAPCSASWAGRARHRAHRDAARRADSDEAELYAELLGPVDFTIPTPAVVRDGHLAPYQELAWLTEPLDSERAWLAEHDTRFRELVTALHDDVEGPLVVPGWVITRVRERRRGADDDGEVPWEAFQRRAPGAGAARACASSRSAGLALPDGAPRGEAYRRAARPRRLARAARGLRAALPAPARSDAGGRARYEASPPRCASSASSSRGRGSAAARRRSTGC